MLAKRFALLILCILLFLCKSVEAANQNFIIVTDVHFDPFLSCQHENDCPLINTLINTPAQNWQEILNSPTSTLSSYSQDTNAKLWLSTLQELRRIINQQKPAFIIWQGDSLAHDYLKRFQMSTRIANHRVYQNFVASTYQFLALSLKQVTGNIPVYFVMGNNDGDSNSYCINRQKTAIKTIADIWNSVFHLPPDFKNEFSQQAYYHVLQDKSLDMIFLNSTIFSVNAYIYPATKRQSALLDHYSHQELVWMKKLMHRDYKLHRKIWLIMHIPPILDPLETIKQSHPITLWRPDCFKQFLHILTTTPAATPDILAAHTHTDMRFTIANKKNLILSPSISPILGNDPSIKRYYYEHDTATIINAKSYRLNLAEKTPSWAEHVD